MPEAEQPFREAPPVVFLDIDGVLNSVASRKRYPAGDERKFIDPDAVKRLNAIAEATGCVFVLSSMWRVGAGLVRTREMLAAAGFTGKIVDETPLLFRERRDEIADWIEAEHAGGPIAILDDEEVGDLAPRLVRTDFETGLLDEHVHRVVALIRGEAAHV